MSLPGRLLRRERQGPQGYDASGSFLQMIDLETELGAEVQPRPLVRSQDGSAAYMLASITLPMLGAPTVSRVSKLSPARP